MTETSMATVDELLGMARDCYTQARDSLDPSTKRQLAKLGDDYLKQASRSFFQFFQKVIDCSNNLIPIWALDAGFE